MTSISQIQDIPEDAGSSQAAFKPVYTIPGDLEEDNSNRKLVGTGTLLAAKGNSEVKLDLVDVFGELLSLGENKHAASTIRLLTERTWTGVQAEIANLEMELEGSAQYYRPHEVPASNVVPSAIMLGKEDEDEVTKRYRDLESRYCDDPALLHAFRRMDPQSLEAFLNIAYGYFKPRQYQAAESWYSRIAHEQVRISSPRNMNQVSRSKAKEPPTDEMEDDETSGTRSLVSIAELPAEELFINVPNVLGEYHLERKAIYSGNQDDLMIEPSNISAVPSVVSTTDSIFSIISDSSMSSLVGPESAVDRLVSLLLDDGVFKSLCTDGLSEIERERFERNLRRLLKEFAVELRKEAECEEHRHAAHFVRLRARNSAYLICSTLSKNRKGKEKAVEVEPTYLSEESGSDRSDDEVDDLQQLEVFIKNSRAIGILRANLRAFVHPANAPSSPDERIAYGNRTPIQEAEGPNKGETTFVAEADLLEPILLDFQDVAAQEISWDIKDVAQLKDGHEIQSQLVDNSAPESFENEAGYTDDQLSLARQLQAEFGSGHSRLKKDKKKQQSLASSEGYFPAAAAAAAVLPIAAFNTTPLDVDPLKEDSSSIDYSEPIISKPIDVEQPNQEFENVAPDGLKADYKEDQLSLARQLLEEFASGRSSSRKDKKKRQSLPSTPDQIPSRSGARSPSIGLSAQILTKSPAATERKYVYSEDQLKLARQLEVEFKNKMSKKDKKAYKKQGARSEEAVGFQELETIAVEDYVLDEEVDIHEQPKLFSEETNAGDVVMTLQQSQAAVPDQLTGNLDERSFSVQVDQLVDIQAMAATKPERQIFLSWLPPMDGITSLLKLKSKKIEKGKTRVKWKCKCGHTITDDFQELKPGALNSLAERLSRSTNTISKESRSTYLSRAFWGGLQGLRTMLSFRYGASKQELNLKLPTHELRSATNAIETESSHPQGSAPTLELMFLLLLYNEGRHVTRLLQLDLAKLAAESDKALFKILHEQYKGLKKPWLSWISLRTLDSINFVHFEAYRSELVDVRKKDDLPSPGDKEYRYIPAPPELIPPIGSHYLVHVLQYPECAEEEPLRISRFPKKLKEQLKCRGGMKPGWGLQIVECWDAQKIWLLIFMFFGLGSLAIGVLWAVFEHSIQDAFAIAGYMVAFATVSVGSVQAILAPGL